MAACAGATKIDHQRIVVPNQRLAICTGYAPAPISATAISATDLRRSTELLRGLSKLGVSGAEIRAKARQFGLPEDILNRISRR